MYTHSCIVLTAPESISRKEMKRGEIQLPTFLLAFVGLQNHNGQGMGGHLPSYFCFLAILFLANRVFVFLFFTESMGKDILRGLLKDRVLNQEKMRIEGDENDSEIDLA